MKSKRARAYLDQRVKDETVTYASALEAVRIVEEEAEDALQALREKFAADIHNLVDRWDESDKKIDRLWTWSGPNSNVKSNDTSETLPRRKSG